MMFTKFVTRKILVLTLFAVSASTLAAGGAERNVFIYSPLALQTVRTAQKENKTEKFLRTELFFGRRKPDGTEVSPEEFEDFINVVVTPEFPDGLTILDGIGQFRDSKGNLIKEKAKILILLYPSNTRRKTNRKIERIREAYKKRFAQQSVLRADDKAAVRVSF